ncbi:10 kDa chaperonin GROES [Streptococcus thermophilus CNCM I-1630]|nr:10 kDa chaperonin GROES [Streptococcus thermophilus CNCM I-1630]
MALKPLGDRIIVRFEETEEKTASGFVLAGASHETTKTAEVLAVCEGTRTLTGELIGPLSVGRKAIRVPGWKMGSGYSLGKGREKEYAFPFIPLEGRLILDRFLKLYNITLGSNSQISSHFQHIHET